jgi:hypothetical protein
MIRLQTEDCNRCNCGGRHTYNLTDNCLEIFLARIKLSKVKYGENPQSEPNADKENLKENAFRVHNTSTQVPRQIRAKRSIAHIKVLIRGILSAVTVTMRLRGRFVSDCNKATVATRKATFRTSPRCLAKSGGVARVAKLRESKLV